MGVRYAFVSVFDWQFRDVCLEAEKGLRGRCNERDIWRRNMERKQDNIIII